MKSQTPNPKLVIEVEEKSARIEYGGKKLLVNLDVQTLLGGIGKVVKDPRAIKGVRVKIGETTFSTTRQVVAVVNTLAWQLGVKVNGQRQLRATYSGKPNITKPYRGQ